MIFTVSNGYHLYVDSFTSKRLFKHLAENSTVACGIAMGNCMKTSSSLKAELFQKGEYTFQQDGYMLMVQYNNKKEIHFLSAMHEIKVERLLMEGRDGLAASKFSLVNDYKKNMRGVDRNDALIGTTNKWTVKVVMYFIEEAALDVFILFNKVYPRKILFMNFKLEVIDKTITRVDLRSRCVERTKKGKRKESKY